ncbi:methyltransferase domain-containing protein [Qaidamihabitans albus]|uniref:methyltransferase domain-containing protein n=1 Tax=Qaidamihabitans albus TaxID=2795733 RepID=UPI0018F13B20|nr:methyltransferase domain-containing protein [Qaidamihabitans albus]
MSTTEHTETDTLIAMLDVADALPTAVALRNRSYDLLCLAPGALVADVGCGPGRAVAELTERGTAAVGVDADEHMIATARGRWPEADFRTGDACALPFAEGTLAGYRAEKVFHQLSDAPAAVAEARRVLAPGGHIVLVGQDWDAIAVDADDAELTRAILRARADTLPNPRAARRYRNLLLDGGFIGVTVEAGLGVLTDRLMLPVATGFAEAAHAAGAITREQADTWITEQRRRAESDRFLLAVPMFLAVAARP